MNPEITLYNGVTDTTGTATTLTEAIDVIRSNTTIAKKIEKIRAASGDEQERLKKKLPAVTWSGTFKQRKANQLLEYSHFICLDYDKLPTNALEDIKAEFAASKHVFAVFISPRGNGLKVVVPVTTGPGQHAATFKSLSEHFHLTIKGFELLADESGKDVSRLCFLSADANIYVNENATYYTPQVTEEIPMAATPGTDANLSDSDKFSRLRQFTDRIKTYTPNKRNDYVSTFVMNCKEHGLPEAETQHYCFHNFADYRDGEKGLHNIVSSVYKNSRIPFGTKQFFAGRRGNSFTHTTPPPGATTDSRYDETQKFWYEVHKPKEGTTEYKFDHDGLTFFLANNGFRKMRLGEKGYQYIRLAGNGLIEAVEPDAIGHFIMEYLHKDVHPDPVTGLYSDDNTNDALREVRRMYKRGLKGYKANDLYTSLPELTPRFLKDDENTCYLYFNNAYLKISKEGAETYEYSSMDHNLWARQRKQHNITLVSNEEITKSIAYQFFKYAIVGDDTGDDDDIRRLQSMFTTIGYAVDTYKDPTNTRAIVLQDKKTNKTGSEANGGSGKTLTAKMIGYMTNICLIDGKSFSFENTYPYDTFKADHKLIVYNDVNRRFSFETLFHRITEDFTYDKRYVDSIVIPHEEAPKHMVITNYSLMGDGSSYNRRQQIIEFSDYFNDKRTPKDVFNHRFFIDWDETEWNRYYNFIIFCVTLYKKIGLIPFPATNVKINKLYAMAGEEFVEWMDDQFIGSQGSPALRIDTTRIPAKELFEQVRNLGGFYSKLTNSNKVTNWIKLWCEARGWECERPKSNGTYYWTFTKKEAKP
jgi:hypothetical protein